MEPSRPPPCQQKRRLSKVSSRWRTCVTNLVSLVVWVYGICGSRGEGIVKHHETMNINSRVQSKASILRLDAHDQENVKYHFQWEICSILNHPDPPLKCSDGCWVGTTRLRKTLAKHLFHQKKWESFRNTFWKCIVENSHLQVLLQDVVQQLTQKTTAENLSVATLFPFTMQTADLGKAEVRWHRYSPRNLQLEWMTST